MQGRSRGATVRCRHGGGMAHHGGLDAGGVEHEGALDLGRAQAVAAHVEHVVHAARDPVVPGRGVGVEIGVRGQGLGVRG